MRSRILDSFLGRRDPKTGNRNPADSDYRRALLMPDDADWRGRFHLTDHVLEPSDIRADATPPDGPFVAVTNWQQFVMPREQQSPAERLGLDVPEEPQGEVVAEFMTEYPHLIVMNDEAHHVHGKRTVRADELVWRRFMDAPMSGCAGGTARTPACSCKSTFPQRPTTDPGRAARRDEATKAAPPSRSLERFQHRRRAETMAKRSFRDRLLKGAVASSRPWRRAAFLV